MYIYSKKKELVACIYKFRKKINNRINLSPENELLQASIIKFDKKFNLNRHIHTKVPRKTIGTQEIWIVMEGKLKATFYETDKTKICSKILKKGDISILFLTLAISKALSRTRKSPFVNQSTFGRLARVGSQSSNDF